MSSRDAIRLIMMGSAVAAAGCTSPLERSMEEQLREQLISTQLAYREAVADAPVVVLDRTTSEVNAKITPEERAELDSMAGPEAYGDVPLELGPDLMDKRKVKTLHLSLRRALQMAAKNNLDVQVAQMQPAIQETVITQAEAVFDAVFFANFNFQKLDTPFPSTNAFTSAAFGTVQEDTRTFVTGIRKNLASGGQLTLQTQMGRNNRTPSFFEVNTHYDANILLSLTQPLLRGFGSDVNRSQIMLSQNAKASDVQILRQELLRVLTDAETAYWNLFFARYQLLFRQRLVERTVTDRDKIGARLEFDATPVEYTEANSFVGSRQADVIRARNRVRGASDTLKRIINSPELSVADEILIVPVDVPADVPIRFSLLDAVSTALRRRPEIRRALLNIQDTSIRQRVADNARLPQLDLAASMRFNGIGDNVGAAQDVVTDGDFIDYLLGLQFEVPIGNREREAQFEQRKLERRQAVIVYKNLAQQVVGDVKSRLRNVLDAFELIKPERDARLASTANIRALDAREDAGEAMTPTFLDLRLRRLEDLTDNETREMQALVGYQISIAQLYQAMGTLLERNGIDFHEEPVERAAEVGLGLN